MVKEFMLIFRNEKSAGGEKPSAEQMQAVMKQWQSWIKGIATAGKYSGTNRLLIYLQKFESRNIFYNGRRFSFRHTLYLFPRRVNIFP